MNKKWILIAVLAALVLGVGAYAAAHMVVVNVQEDEGVTESADVFELSGAIIELGEEHFVMQDAAMGPVQVNFGDDTLFEGVSAQELALEQIVQILYDGKMTRSLPAQVYALKVGMYPVSGEVVAAQEGSITLVREEIGDEVIVFLPEGAPEIAVGDRVTAYTNGAMTMSLPAQITALGIVVE